jgi:hypothetical protein
MVSHFFLKAHPSAMHIRKLLLLSNTLGPHEHVVILLILPILPILSKESETPNHAEQSHGEATRKNIPTAELQPIVEDADQRSSRVSSLAERPNVLHRVREGTNP